MNIKRAIGFGAMLWILIFVVWSVLMFAPWFKDGEMRIYVTHWILLVPMVWLLAKWYFKATPPTWIKGLYLGLIGLATGTVLDLVITVPLFVKSYAGYYSDWRLWVGFALSVALCLIAGWEFDATYSKKEAPPQV
jgi:hypothetical protein